MTMSRSPDPHARDPAGRSRRGHTPKADRLGRAGHRAALRRLREAFRAQRFQIEPDEPAQPPAEGGDEEQDESGSLAPAVAADDDLPEHTLYRDDGCHVAPACLHCPLPRCIFDRRGTEQQAARRARNRRIRTLTRRGWSTVALAERFGLSPAQVRRIRATRRGRPRRPHA
jgi:hypothetical protein